MNMGSLTPRRLMMLFLSCLFICPVPARAATAGSRRVLMLYSDRSFAVSFALTSTFQTELVEQSDVPIEFHEVTLQGPLFAPSEDDEPTINYIHSLLAEREPNLIVPLGGTAVRFALRHRQQLFPSAPLLLAAVEARHLKTSNLDT